MIDIKKAANPKRVMKAIVAGVFVGAAAWLIYNYTPITQPYLIAGALAAVFALVEDIEN